MSDWDPLALYDAAQRRESKMSGYYNENVRLETPVGPVLVRIPIHRAARMDLRIWDEATVLPVVSARVDHTPHLLYASAQPQFQIHEFVKGRQLNEVSPRGTRLPARVISDVLQLFSQLATVRRSELPILPPDWPDDGNCVELARLLSSETRRVFDENQDEFGNLFRSFGIPGNPLATVEAAWTSLTSRPFRLLHADVHRQNIVMSPDGAVFLDWELALWGDPVFDLAVHVHKMAYFDSELQTLLSGWESMSEPAVRRLWRNDLSAYLNHERVKSAIVDSVRYTNEILLEGTSQGRRELLLGKLTEKLNAAGMVWGWSTSLTAHDVRALIDNWSLARS